MSYKQLHLHIAPHPSPTSVAAIDYACALAGAFKANLSVSSARVSVKTPSHWLAGPVLAGIARQLETEAAAKGEELDAHLAKQAVAFGVGAKVNLAIEHWPAGQGHSTWRGRTSDVCVLGLRKESTEQRICVEEWLFGVGRACLIYPDNAPRGFSLDCVVVCWDFSKSAARVVGDALPLLQRAKQVRITIVRGEKDLPVDDVKSPLLEYLAAQGVTASADEIEINGAAIGEAILDHANAVQANLIVMGAFGHSRAKEFILGGATKELLDCSSIPLFMSH